MTGMLAALAGALPLLGEMSLTAAYAAAVVALLRLALRKRAPRQVVCLLWLVVFARLLVPVSPESPVSIVPDARQVQMIQDLPSRLAGGNPAQNHAPAGNPAPGQPAGGTAGPVSQGNTGPGANPALGLPGGVEPAGPRPQAPSGFPWQTILAGVWLAGALSMCLYGLASYLRLKGRLYDAIRVGEGIWEHPSVGSPFILGLFRPRIFLPSGLRGQPRKFILCHELAHLRRLDHIVKPVCWLALALHWFNPFVWMAYILMSRDIEAACDEAVIRLMGPQVKADYSATLLSLATNGRVPAPCPLAFDEGSAKGRIKNVLSYRRPALWIVVVSAIAAVLAAVCLLTDPVSAGEPDSPDPDVSASQDPSPAPDGDLALLDPWMEEVLNGQRDFTGNESGGQVNIDLLNGAYPEDAPFTAITLSKFAVVDLDRDGVNELVLWPSVDGDDSLERISTLGYLILRRQGDGVTSYNPSYRSFAQIKEDGAFWYSGGTTNSGFGLMRFIGGGFTIDPIAYSNIDYNLDNTLLEAYFVDGRSVTQEEYADAAAGHFAKPDAAWYAFADGRVKRVPAALLPADNYNLDLSVPDFLDGEQLAAYYQTYMVYSHFFGSSSEMVDSTGYGRGTWGYAMGTWKEYNGLRYFPATGVYANWDDFEGLMMSVFTEDFWNERNSGLYINIGGAMYYADWARGGGGYNENFPETFQLLEKTGDAVSFTMTGYYSDTRQFEGFTETGYYSDTRQFEGITDEQREEWLAAGWEYSIDFPMRMVRTENGWRFDEFHNARTENGIPRFYEQRVPNPNVPPAPTANPEPPAEPEPEPSPSDAPAVCAHGLDDIRLEYVNSRLAAVCNRDDFVYPVPGVTSGDYQGTIGHADGGGWVREDLDGDGRMEISVFITNSEVVVDSRIITLDVENGALITSTFRLQPLIDDFKRNVSYEFIYDEQAIEMTYQGCTVRDTFDDSYWSYMSTHGGGFAPEIWPTDLWITWTGGSFLCGFPVHNGRGHTFEATARWPVTYSPGQGLQAGAFLM